MITVLSADRSKLDRDLNRDPTGELDADLYTSYYGPTDVVTRDDLAQEVEPAADLEV